MPDLQRKRLSASSCEYTPLRSWLIPLVVRNLDLTPGLELRVDRLKDAGVCLAIGKGQPWSFSLTSVTSK